MGCYINPKGMTKEQFLKKYGERVDRVPEWQTIPQDKLPVCIVDNTMFTAAGVCYDEHEIEEFLVDLGIDGRPHAWFIVPVVELVKVSPLFAVKHYYDHFKLGLVGRPSP